MEQDLKLKYKVNSQTIISLIVFLIVTTIYASANYIVNGNFYLFIVLLIFPISCVIVTLSVNRYRFKKFVVLLKYIASKYQSFEIKEDFIHVRKGTYKMKPLTQSYDVSINPSFEKSPVIYCITEDSIILFIMITEVLIFKKYCKPIVFSGNTEDEHIIKQVQSIKIYQKEILGSETEIRSSQFPNNISVLKIHSNVINKYL